MNTLTIANCRVQQYQQKKSGREAPASRLAWMHEWLEAERPQRKHMPFHLQGLWLELENLL